MTPARALSVAVGGATNIPVAAFCVSLGGGGGLKLGTRNNFALVASKRPCAFFGAEQHDGSFHRSIGCLV